MEVRGRWHILNADITAIYADAEFTDTADIDASIQQTVMAVSILKTTGSMKARICGRYQKCAHMLAGAITNSRAIIENTKSMTLNSTYRDDTSIWTELSILK